MKTVPVKIQIKDDVVKRMDEILIDCSDEQIYSGCSNLEYYAHLFCKHQLIRARAKRKARAKNKAIRPRLIKG